MFSVYEPPHRLPNLSFSGKLLRNKLLALLSGVVLLVLTAVVIATLVAVTTPAAVVHAAGVELPAFRYVVIETLISCSSA